MKAYWYEVINLNNTINKFNLIFYFQLFFKNILIIIQEGYIRTSSEKFSLDDVSDVFTHLTNDAI